MTAGRAPLRPVRVTVTGFGSFPGMRANPTAALAPRIAASRRLALHGIDARAVVLDTTYARLDARIAALLADGPPDVLLMLGVAGRARTLRVESRGVGHANATAADARGGVPGQSRGGPRLRTSRVPVPLAAAALARSGLPVRASIDAGRYLCNAAYYRALVAKPRTLVLFVHVPMAAARRPRAAHRTAKPSLTLMERGLVELVLALARARRLIR